MNGISEIYEMSYSDEVLKTRTKNACLHGLGPVDLCVTTRIITQTGLKKLLKRTSILTTYHYVYGVDTSSVTSIGAYFKNLFDYFVKTGKGKIISGYFFVFDLFSNSDVRLEIEIPGSIAAYAIDENGMRISPSELNWQGCYLSSVLRFFYSSNENARFLELFSSPTQIESFFVQALNFLPKLGFVLGDIRDTAQYGLNLLFPAFNNYLLEHKRYRLHESLYKKYIEYDPLFMVYLCESSVKMGKFDEILGLLSTQIKITPHAFPLYFSAAKAYYKKGEFFEAINLCQYLIELNLEVFKYWELAIKCLIKVQNFSAALIYLNFIPIYTIQGEPEKIDMIIHEYDEDYRGVDKRIMKKPKEIDFVRFEGQTSYKTKKEKALIKKLTELPGNQYKHALKRVYSLLIKLEKSLGWDNLLTLRLQTLSSSNPINDFSPLTISQSLISLPDSTPTLQTSKFTSLQKSDQKTDSTLQLSHILSTRSYFLSPQITANKLFLISNPQRKQSELLTDLFIALHNDLKILMDWQKEISNIQIFSTIQKNVPFGGDLWILRGKLAKRLKRNRTALRAYENVVVKGFSLFAWYKIIKLSAKAGNPNATVKSIVEVFEVLRHQGVVLEKVPEWMEKVLAKLCSECGFKQVLSLVQENGSRFGVLRGVLEKLVYWKVEGS